MKKHFIFLIFALFISLVSCTENSTNHTTTKDNLDNTVDVTNSADETSTPQTQFSGQIYLYGETHGVVEIMNKELEAWREYYRNENMRHLFLEYSYSWAEFLNIWMQSDSDDILNTLIDDEDFTVINRPYVKEFFKTIKRDCPETIFHGVGIDSPLIGERYLQYLETNNLKDSEQYLFVQEFIEKSKRYIENGDDTYRENIMTENFIREFDKLNGESVMGIFGAMHTRLEPMSYMGSALCLGNQLKKHYGEAVHSEDLSDLSNVNEPYRVDIIMVGGKDYEASYFGEHDLTPYTTDYLRQKFWRLENAYDDFKDKPKTSYVFPYQSYPMTIETGQVFIIDTIKTDGSVERWYYRSDDDETTDTVGFKVD